jgi:hypothetical protein
LQRLLATADLRLQTALLRTLDHLTPKADPELLIALDKVTTEGAASTDPSQLARVHTLQLLAHRLRTR